VDPALATSQNLRQLGLTPGFAMKAPLAEDLLVFGLDHTGAASAISLSGTYDRGEIPAALKTDTRTYQVAFGTDNAYTIKDIATDTVVSAGTLNTTDLNIRFGDWSLTLGGIPANGDTFTVQPTEDPLGDNRNAAAMARLQSRKDLLGGDATLQQEYESLVYRVGSLSVQAEVARNAQQVVYDHAVEARDRVSGVNLDEELADLLRFQQAYQANAQVIQTANRIFDALLQRL
jgi:flagellar hook-associated protein 1 FlgK